jgi:hypothetical protein
LGAVGDMLERMWDDALWRLKLQAELDASRRGPSQAKGRKPPQEKGRSGDIARSTGEAKKKR